MHKKIYFHRRILLNTKYNLKYDGNGSGIKMFQKNMTELFCFKYLFTVEQFKPNIECVF